MLRRILALATGLVLAGALGFASTSLASAQEDPAPAPPAADAPVADVDGCPHGAGAAVTPTAV